MEKKVKKKDGHISRKEFLNTIGTGVGLFAVSWVGNSFGIKNQAATKSTPGEIGTYESMPYGGHKKKA